MGEKGAGPGLAFSRHEGGRRLGFLPHVKALGQKIRRADAAPQKAFERGGRALSRHRIVAPVPQIVLGAGGHQAGGVAPDVEGKQEDAAQEEAVHPVAPRQGHDALIIANGGPEMRFFKDDTRGIT